MGYFKEGHMLILGYLGRYLTFQAVRNYADIKP